MFSQQVLSDRVIVMSTAVLNLVLEYVSDQHQNKYKYSSTATKFSMYNKSTFIRFSNLILGYRGRRPKGLFAS